MTLRIAKKRFGKLVAIAPTDRRIRNRVVWEFLCDCGNTVFLRGDVVASGGKRSCSCLQGEDLSGQVFGRLTAIKPVKERANNGAVRWLCDCSCGKQAIVLAASLKTGNTKSCGCLHADVLHSQVGSLNPRWNSNLTIEDREKGRLYPDYKEWREAVYTRDGYTCQRCGKQSGPLNAHHVESYTDNKELRTVLDNGITLCKECHDNFHHQFGRGHNTREQLDKFMEEGG